MFQIGDYRLHTLDVQHFVFDGSPLPQRSSHLPVAQEGVRPKVRLATRLLTITGNGKNILVDAGVGLPCGHSRWASCATTPFRLAEELERIGLEPGDITDLVFTHLHSDHIGGAFSCVDGQFRLTFPNARIIVQEECYRVASAPSLQEQSSFNPAIIELLGHLPSLFPVSGTHELFPGIDVMISNGHTRGQQLVRVSDGRRTLLHGGDIVPTAFHIQRQRVSGNDIDPRTVIEEKAGLLEEACRQGWVLFFGHDPDLHAATVMCSENGFVPGPAPQF